MRKYLCISENCCIFASEKETKNKLNPKTRKSREIMKTSTLNFNRKAEKIAKREGIDYIDAVDKAIDEYMPQYRYRVARRFW